MCKLEKVRERKERGERHVWRKELGNMESYIRIVCMRVNEQ